MVQKIFIYLITNLTFYSLRVKSLRSIMLQMFAAKEVNKIVRSEIASLQTRLLKNNSSSKNLNPFRLPLRADTVVEPQCDESILRYFCARVRGTSLQSQLLLFSFQFARVKFWDSTLVSTTLHPHQVTGFHISLWLQILNSLSTEMFSQHIVLLEFTVSPKYWVRQVEYFAVPLKCFMPLMTDAFLQPPKYFTWKSRFGNAATFV